MRKLNVIAEERRKPWSLWNLLEASPKRRRLSLVFFRKRVDPFIFDSKPAPPHPTHSPPDLQKRQSSRIG